jgi:hypothetical protein
MSGNHQREGLGFARLMMVLSCISPLFFLWAIRGNKLVPDRYFVPGCLTLALVPTGLLWLRLRIARRNQDQREIVVAEAEDHRDHLLVYLFAMLLPLYPIDTGGGRDFAAMMAALALIVFMFWSLNLHYMNVLFSICGYRVFTISVDPGGNPISGWEGYAVITRRRFIPPGEKITAYRLSNTVLFEVRK